MKRLTKITVSLFMIMLSALVLVACGNNDADLVAKAKEALTISYQSGDSATSVTKDITLKTKEGEVTVAWASNDAAIGSDGKVIRPTDANKPVELTATLSKGSAKDTKKFNVTVIAEVAVDPNVALVAAAKEALAIGFATGDTKDSVTQNLTLVAKQGDVAVVWTSNKAAIVSTAGVVTRPADANQPVELTATLSKGDARDTKVFTVTVKKAEAPVEYDKALLAYYKDTLDNPEFRLTENFELIDEIEGKTITWAVTNNGEFFNVDGTVTRPTYTQGDQTITLVGTVEGKKVTFYVVVSKLEQTNEEKIQEVLDKVTVVPSTTTGYQEANFAVITTDEIDENPVEIVWTSSNDEVMNTKGEIIPFEAPAEQTVILTASITYEGVTREKEVTFKIKAVSGVYDSLQDALVRDNYTLETPTKPIGKKVYVKSVAFYADTKDGFYVMSEDNMLGFVYAKRDPNVVKPGKLYGVSFTVSVYFGIFQLTDASFINEREGDLPTITPEEITLDQFVAMEKPSNESNPIQHKLFSIVGIKVRVDSPTDNYKTFLVNADLDNNTTLTNTNSIMIYYNSNIEGIRTLNGKKLVSVDVINNGYRTNNVVWNVNFVGKATDIEVVPLTDEEAVEISKDNWDKKISDLYYKAADLKFVTKDAETDAKIVWISSHPEIISALGVVVVPEVPTVVTLTATITRGDATVTLTKEVNVGALPNTNVEDVLAADKGEIFQVTGIVTSNSANGTYTLQDASGAIAIYVLKDVKLEVGFVYTIIGSKDVYKGLNQLRQIETAIKGEAGTAVSPVDLTEEIISESLIAHQNKLVNISKAYVVKRDVDSFGTVTLTLKVGTETLTLKWDNRVSVSTADKDHISAIKEGDFINVVAAPLGWSDGALIGYDKGSQVVVVEPSDADKLYVAVNALELKEEYTESFTLPTQGLFGSAITWTINEENEAYLVDGKLVIPTEGEVAVTLTATFALGEASETKEFELLLKYVDPNLVVTYTETFDNSEATSSYANGSFVGVNGVTWTYVHSRNEGSGTTDDYAISGKGIMLRRIDETSSLSATFANGIKSFSFEYRKAFTSAAARNYKVDVTHNGTTMTYDLESFGSGSGAATDVYTFTRDLNLDGEVTIKIYAAGAKGNQQATFDNFKWTQRELNV